MSDSITDIGADAANSMDTTGRIDPDDYERFDISGLPFVKTHPSTAVGGTAVALRYFPGNPDEDLLDYGYAGLVVEDPFIMSDDGDLENMAIFKSQQDKGDDYKVVNLDDKATETIDGVGVEFGGHVFRGEHVEEFEEDQIIIKLTETAGRSATRALDVHGKGEADVVRDGDGTPVLNERTGYPELNGALFEYPLNGSDDDRRDPRFARDTQLRPDVKGREVVFLLQRKREVKAEYNGPAYCSTTSVADDDGEYEELAPTDEFDPDPVLDRATGYLKWHYPDKAEIDHLQKRQLQAP